METKCCGTCKWQAQETDSACPDWVCCNENSRYWSDYTGYDDVCPDWEERE